MFLEILQWIIIAVLTVLLNLLLVCEIRAAKQIRELGGSLKQIHDILGTLGEEVFGGEVNADIIPGSSTERSWNSGYQPLPGTGNKKRPPKGGSNVLQGKGNDRIRIKILERRINELEIEVERLEELAEDQSLTNMECPQ